MDLQSLDFHLVSVGTWAAPCSLGRRLPAEAAPEVTLVLQHHAATFLPDEVGFVAGAGRAMTPMSDQRRLSGS
jgi:hypothetical protein